MKNNWDIRKEIVELRTGMDINKYLRKCIEKVQEVDEKHILQGLGEVLDAELKNWVKNNLKKDLLFHLNFYLENI